MISEIKLSSIDKQNTPRLKTNGVSFGGFQDTASRLAHTYAKKAADGGIKLVQQCEKHPMINVTVLDLATAIIPRTLVETFAVPKDNTAQKQDENKEKKHHKINLLAGMEAFRRESSGLIVNCLIPGYIVYGIAKGLNKFVPAIMKPFNKSNLASNWADSNTIEKITHYYKNAQGTGDEKLFNAFKNLTYDISGVDGKDEKAFNKILTSDDDKIFEKLVKAVHDEHNGSKLSKEAFDTIAAKTHITENLKFKGDNKYHSTNLESIYSNMVKFLRGVAKENITEASQLETYAKKASKFVNWKSLGGLAVIIPLAISMQPINRWITHKSAGQKGAPIYNGKEYQEPTKEEKAQLFKQKIISVSSMIGVGLLSMMKLPTLNMLQFKGKFPSMDQARIISTATFASRMGASEDANDLREATIRDIATFLSFYFLGDFAAKGIATYIEHKDPNAKLINTLKPLKRNANPLEKFWHWTKHTALKSTDELATVKDKRLRTICQIGNLAFSLIALGVFIPLYNRTVTNKKEQERKEKELANIKPGSSTGAAAGSTLSSDIVKASIKHNPAFRAIFNS